MPWIPGRLEPCEASNSTRGGFQAGRARQLPSQVWASRQLGTILGVPFCAEETRVRAAALAIGGGGIGPVASDPVAHIPRLAPRPVLFVNASRDETIPRENAEALHEAARDPKEVLWFDCTHSELPGAALKAMWRFLGNHLEV